MSGGEDPSRSGGGRPVATGDRTPARRRGDALVPPVPGFFSIYRVTRLLARFFSWLWFGLKTSGQEHIPAEGGALIASNHRSVLDPVTIFAPLRRTGCFLAKDSLFRNRLFAFYLRRIGTIPVDRTPERGAVEGLRISLRLLKEGRLLGFFPEGTRSLDGKLQPLHSGVALLAKRSGVPVVPTIVIGTFEAWPRRRKFPRRHPVRVVYGQPLRYERGESYDSFCGRLAKALRDLARSAGAEHLIAEESGPVAGDEPAVTRSEEP